ncbi:MAG: amidohydrolase family protein [Pirellulaceae bacterium]
MNKTICFVAIQLLAWMTPVAYSQVPPPAPPQSAPVLLTGATIHTITGETIEDGQLLFVDGKIAAVGKTVEAPSQTTAVSFAGQHIYPGMIEAYSQIGLTEISSIPATLDHTETGSINPNVHAQVAINPDSDIIPVTRSGGVLLALSVPTGGMISGRSTLIQLDGWTYEDMTVLPNAALHLNWPSSFRPARRRPVPNEDQASPDDRIRELRELFEQARNYRQLREQPSSGQSLDLRLEGLGDVVTGKIPLMVRADQLADIQAAVAFAVEQKTKLIILGGYDAPMCADLLKKHDVPVIVSAVYRLPLRKSDPDDHAYTLPARLQAAGIRFCISSADRSETWNSRNLPFHAGTAVAFGLSADEALKAVTLYPARILNVADRVGSLEVGKDATVFVSSGDPLDTRSSITAAFIQGRAVDLSNRQTRLYEKYKLKYEQQKPASPK